MSHDMTAWVAVIVPAISAFSSIMAFLTSRKAVQKVNEVHVLINSRLSELVALTRTAAHAEGVMEGTAQAQARAQAQAQEINDHSPITVTGSPAMVTGELVDRKETEP